MQFATSTSLRSASSIPRKKKPVSNIWNFSPPSTVSALLFRFHAIGKCSLSRTVRGRHTCAQPHVSLPAPLPSPARASGTLRDIKNLPPYSARTFCAKYMDGRYLPPTRQNAMGFVPHRYRAINTTLSAPDTRRKRPLAPEGVCVWHDTTCLSATALLPVWHWNLAGIARGVMI